MRKFWRGIIKAKMMTDRTFVFASFFEISFIGHGEVELYKSPDVVPRSRKKSLYGCKEPPEYAKYHFRNMLPSEGSHGLEGRRVKPWVLLTRTRLRRL